MVSFVLLGDFLVMFLKNMLINTIVMKTIPASDTEAIKTVRLLVTSVDGSTATILITKKLQQIAATEKIRLTLSLNRSTRAIEIINEINKK